jgi:uncharacterized protein (DUF1501 family)
MPLLRALSQLETDRILLLVQLAGGNDGLNTVIPYQNDIYYQKRPVLAIRPEHVVPITDDVGLHPSLAPLAPMWDSGQMGIVQGVGYTNHNLSHFRSTDIWVSASDAEVVTNTGWIGRYVDDQYPDYLEQPLEKPAAVQIGTSLPLLFQGPSARMGLSFHTVGAFELIAQRGEIFDTSDVPPSPAGAELAFLRQTANQTIRYGQAIRDAFNAATNSVEYPVDTYRFGQSLSTVARCIRGGLGTRIFVVSLPDFDTHVTQDFRHGRQLAFLADALRTFYDDLASDGLDERVLTVTFSEFGRRVEENASRGTDHGTAAPLFVLGPEAKGGLYGLHPDLGDVDGDGNMKHHVDFRSVYTTVLAKWFVLEQTVINGVLGPEQFDQLDFVRSSSQVAVEANEELPQRIALDQNYPNPFQSSTRIVYRLERGAHVRLAVYSVEGRLVQTLIDGDRGPGSHEELLNGRGLPSGRYFYRLEAATERRTRQMTLLR